MHPTCFFRIIKNRNYIKGGFNSPGISSIIRICFFLVYIVFSSGCGVTRHPSVVKSNPDVLDSLESGYTYFFSEATKLKLLNSSSRAIPLFFKCIALKPANAAPYYQLSEIYFYMGDFPRALAFGKKAVALDGSNTWYLLQLARIYQQKGNMDSTIIVYKKIVKQQPQRYDALLNLALLYLQNNEAKKAANVLEDLQHRYGNNEDIVLALFKAYSVLADHPKCIKLLITAIDYYPDDIRFIGLLAEYYVKLGDYQNALHRYNQLLALDPDNEKGLLSLIEYYRLTKNYAVLQTLSQRYVTDTTFLYQNKIEVVANFIADQNLLREAHIMVLPLIQSMDSLFKNDFRVQTLYCDYYLRTKDYMRAKDKLSYLISHYKTTMPFWEQLIFVLVSLRENKQIIGYCDEGIRVFGNKPFFFLYKGIALYQLKLYSLSCDVLLAGLKNYSGSSDLLVQFYTYLGESFNGLKDYQQSDSFFRKAIALNPGYTHILNNYSYYLAERNVDLDKAQEYIKICLNIEPSSYSYLDTYGWILYKSGHLKAARKVLESALKNGGGKDKTILEHMAIILFKLRNIDDAHKYYKMVTELGEPGNELQLLFKK